MTAWLARRVVLRLASLAAMFVVVYAVAFVGGIKTDAANLRGAETYFNSTIWFVSPHSSSTGPGYFEARAAVAHGQAALTGPRGFVCRALGLCDGLTL